jgi:head-tail adaptor
MSVHHTLHNRLMHSVRLETPSLTSDNAGGFTTQWVLLKRVFAEMIPQGQASYSGGAHVQPTISRYRITLYPDPVIALPLRVIWKDNALHVTHIEDHHTHLVLQAETELSQ